MLRRTAGGKMIDINALMAKNEKVRAVGNMKANARGDIIDSQGRIIKSVNERVNESYSKTVGNKSANIVKKPVSRQVPAPNPVQTKVEPVQEPLPELTQDEKELMAGIDDDLEIEVAKTKKQEGKNARK